MNDVPCNDEACSCVCHEEAMFRRGNRRKCC